MGCNYGHCYHETKRWEGKSNYNQGYNLHITNECCRCGDEQTQVIPTAPKEYCRIENKENILKIKSKLNEFEEKLQEIRAKNGWKIVLEFPGVWIVSIYDKETNKLIASTGAGSISSLLDILKMPLDKTPWKSFS